MGVVTGCGFKEIYRFPHTTYPYSSCICTFLQQHPYFFFHFVKMILRSCIYIHWQNAVMKLGSSGYDQRMGPVGVVTGCGHWVVIILFTS